jgi:hypothetical protein
MAFFKRGSDDAKTAEQSEAEMNALVERFGASIDERIKPLREGFDALKTDWETIKAEATKPPAPAGPTNADGTPRELTEDEKRNNITRASVELSVQTSARLTEREVLDSLPADFADLIPDIRALFNNTPIQRKAQSDYADYCNNCADVVIAKHARKAGLRFNRESKTFFLEDKSTSETRDDGVLSDPDLVWNQQKSNGEIKRWSVADQLRVLDIDPKELADNMKKGVV